MTASPKGETIDRHGTAVRAGTIVRVLSISDYVFANLSRYEIEDLKSTLGEVFPVDEIDQCGNAWVTKWWHFPDGKSAGHGLPLAPSEMEVVDVAQGDA